MSQNTQILNHLKQGHSITPLDALNLYGAFRLAARISDIKNMGYKIVTNIIKQNGKKFASYKLKPITEKEIQEHLNCQSIKFNHNSDTIAYNNEYYCECNELTCKEIYDLLEKNYSIYPF